MQTIWKLVSLAVVVGVGVLVVMQAQKQLVNTPELAGGEEASSQDTPASEAGELAENDGLAAPDQSEPDLVDFDAEPTISRRGEPGSAGTKTPQRSRKAPPTLAEDEDPFQLVENAAHDGAGRNARPATRAPIGHDERPFRDATLDKPRLDSESDLAATPGKSTSHARPGGAPLAEDDDPFSGSAPSRPGVLREPIDDDGGPSLRLTEDRGDDAAEFSTRSQPAAEGRPPSLRLSSQHEEPASVPPRRLMTVGNDESSPLADDDDENLGLAKTSSGSKPKQPTTTAEAADDDLPFVRKGPAKIPSGLGADDREVEPKRLADESLDAEPESDPLLDRASRKKRPAAIEPPPDDKITDDLADIIPRRQRPSAGSKAAGSGLTDEPEAIMPESQPALADEDPFAKDESIGVVRPAPRREEPLAEPTIPAEPAIAPLDDGEAITRPDRAELDLANPAHNALDDEEIVPLPGPARRRSAGLDERRTDAEDRLIESDTAAMSPPAAPPRPAERPKVSIRKIAPASATLGRPMVYQIVVRNNGTVPAYRVAVEDQVSDGVQIDGSIPQALLDGQRLVWKLGTIEPAAEKKISVRVIPRSEGTIGGVATVNFTPDPGEHAAGGARLQFTLDAPTAATLGTPVPFRFKVANIGRKEATAVVIRDVLPSALRHPDGDDLEYEIGALPAGQSREIELVLTAAQAGRIVNRAVVTADGNLTEESSVTVEVSGPQLSAARQGPRRLFPQKQGKYTNTITNPGLNPVPDVHVVETVPAGLEFVEASDNGAYDPARRTITWKFDSLAAGQSRSVHSTLRATARGAQVSVVRAYDSTGASGETVETAHVSGVPALRIEIGEIPPLVEPGEEIKVPVRVVNRGNDAATEIRASVLVPAQLQFVSATAQVENADTSGGKPVAINPRGARNVQEIRFAPIPRLEPGHEATLELTLSARTAGDARIEVAVRCEQIEEPIRRDDMTRIARASE